MTEPKKRGRPSNAEKALRAAGYEVVEVGADVPVVQEAVWLNPETHTALQSAQAYALRVWEGQSESADRPWRVQRVKEALEGQGLPFEGVELP